MRGLVPTRRQRVGLLDAGDGAVEDDSRRGRTDRARRHPGGNRDWASPARAIRSFSAHIASASARSPAMRRDLRPRQAAPGASAMACERILPRTFLELAVAPHIGPVEAAPREPVDGVAGLVGDPFLVHVLVERGRTRSTCRRATSTRMLLPTRVEHVDRFRLRQFPRPRDEGIGLRGERADRAEIDDVGRKLRGERALDIGADLHVLAAAVAPSSATPATSSRKRMQRVQWMQRFMLVLTSGPRSLSFTARLFSLIAAAVEAIGHRLVLQVALAALIADRAIERMIDQQELHHALARLLRLGAVGVDHHAVGRAAWRSDAIGFGAFSCSTRHMRQLPAIARRS